MWSVDAAAFLEDQEQSPDLLALDIPPSLEGIPRSIHVSLLARQGSKVRPRNYASSLLRYIDIQLLPGQLGQVKSTNTSQFAADPLTTHDRWYSCFSIGCLINYILICLEKYCDVAWWSKFDAIPQVYVANVEAAHSRKPSLRSRVHISGVDSASDLQLCSNASVGAFAVWRHNSPPVAWVKGTLSNQKWALK